MMKRRFVGFLLTAVLAGCVNAGFAPSAPPPADSFVSGASPADAPATAKHYVYWTLFAACSDPQVQYARVPLKSKSKTKNYFCSTKNGLHYTSGMALDSSGRLWILSFSQQGATPSEVAVFKLPLKKSSVQEYTFLLSGSSGGDALAFDPSGNLWVSSPGNATVLEYSGPFTKSRTLKPKRTLGIPSGYNMYSLAFDKSANLYAANFKSTGTNSIGVLAPPYVGKNPYFLNGLTAPGGLVFDKSGNLYASSNGSTPAIARYDAKNLKSGASPNIVDPTGIPAASFEASFAFTAQGDLYAANCGNSSSAGINVWPLSTKKFGSSLAPSVIYTNADVAAAGCAWGIAIK